MTGTVHPRVGGEHLSGAQLSWLPSFINQIAESVCLDPLPEGPVLLVDDVVDSRWTLTVGAWLLRSHGSGEVWPLVLALAVAGGDQ